MHDQKFPGETKEYRQARNELLQAELELKRHVEKVAARRRALPLGGLVPQDYTFEEMAPSGERKVKMSELFEPGKDTLVLYNYMFGPKMEKPCPMCTSFLDGIHGNAHHLRQRVNLAVVARSPLARVQEVAKARGWDRFRLLSSEKNSFNLDYHGEDASGEQNPLLHIFVSKGSKVHHFYTTEMQFIQSDPGQNQRHLDMMWPLWNVLDLVPAGRGANWFPSLSYSR
jgi:predicted dithiol-disulfide oxidoreductase (DUF899 family)